MKVRVEFEARPVRHIAVQCDNCKNWFNGRDIASDDILDEVDIEFARFDCPVCGNEFGFNALTGLKSVIELTECADDDVYRECLRKKEIWE